MVEKLIEENQRSLRERIADKVAEEVWVWKDRIGHAKWAILVYSTVGGAMALYLATARLEDGSGKDIFANRTPTREATFTPQSRPALITPTPIAATRPAGITPTLTPRIINNP